LYILFGAVGTGVDEGPATGCSVAMGVSTTGPVAGATSSTSGAIAAGGGELPMSRHRFSLGIV
jgi:hypothetical protein